MTITYKCQSCGSAMEFDGATQLLKCGHCGFGISVDEYERQTRATGDASKSQSENTERTENTASSESTKSTEDNESSQGSQNTESSQSNQSGENSVKIFHCESCGAELVADAFTSATICGFCGNPSLVEDRLSGDFAPSLVIPFKIDKESAKNIYRKWVRKGPLTPRTLASQGTIEKITGIYVPFWLYDYVATDNMEAAATRTRSETHGEYRYVYTDHYSIYRDVKAEFTRIPTDASQKMPDDAMDKMEPFNYAEMTEFKMPYLSGFFSEKYNYTAEENEQRARARVYQYIIDLTRDTISGYSTVNVLSNQVDADTLKDDYALLPIWMLNYRYKGEEHQFMLNGQTGKIVADRPVSMKRAFAWFGLITVATFILTEIGGLFL